ncbi:hypothetical protein [Burkholderia ubonensis]|uniref:hypothetical protein n=1 Tax=Burkholderia ubonensis TaxID=101571 RepID=UPI00075AC8D7|nr:hypothetical protein [Burkholderia ubonensis]KVD63265.1 hypothetical protein WI88_09985 [Burkholderia ubonensis]
MDKKTSTATVINIKSKIFWKRLADSLQREYGVEVGRTTINYSGITRHRSQHDHVTFDAATAVRVRELFAKYGFPEPETWAEFRAAHRYIDKVEEQVDTIKIGYPHIPQVGVDFVRDTYPEVFEAAMFALIGDYKGLATWHSQQGTFERLAREYDEGKDPGKFE